MWKYKNKILIFTSLKQFGSKYKYRERVGNTTGVNTLFLNF